MSLADYVTIDTQYTRSVHLERDAERVARYVPTSRAIAMLQRLARTCGAEEVPRSWALVGPYGTGKSAFALFLSHLLGGRRAETTRAAFAKLEAAAPEVAASLRRELSGDRGHCRVLLTGTPEPLGRRLVQALADGAESYWRGRAGRRPQILGRLRQAAQSPGTLSTSSLLEMVEALQQAVERSGGTGLLLVIDELGKFLEYEARHAGANEIFLLQSLAEHAARPSRAPMHLLVLLHQGFERYARGLGETERNEWLKVQGRFEVFPFVESVEQTLRLMGAAMVQRLPGHLRRRAAQEAAEAAAVLARAANLHGELQQPLLAQLFERCFPLHPVAALLLPALCQKVAQNERTLFSYLGSREPFGFLERIARLDDDGRVLPADLYDYFVENQPLAVSDSRTSRRWAEVVTAVERLGDAPEEEVQLLKAIGLLNIVGSASPLPPSREVLSQCLDDPEAAERAIAALLDKSLILYRRFAREYRVWEGSDFDLEEAAQAAREQLRGLDVAEALNRRQVLGPVVARRYTIEAGTVRYFQPLFASAGTWRSLLREASPVPRLVLFLSESEAQARIFRREVVPALAPGDVAALYANGDAVRLAVQEVLALERIEATTPALANDPVAQRELRDRLEQARAAEGEVLGALLREPEQAVWYWDGRRRRVASRLDLQRLLSRSLQALYRHAPVVRNELINRDKLSSQAAAGRNKLLAAMIAARDREDLGIDKFPAEKAMYRALLRATGLHRRVRGTWTFAPPRRGHDPLCVGPLWKEMEAFADATEGEPRPLSDLFDRLAAPPFGVRRGAIPVFYLAFHLHHEADLALYESRRYVPRLTREHVERMLRRPQDFAVQRFRIEGVRALAFAEYAKVVGGKGGNPRTVLDVARPLVQFVARLPDCTRLTRRLSPTALRVRDAVVQAKSPQRLLFEHLPQACGFPPANSAEAVAENPLRGFGDKLKEALRELKGHEARLLRETRELIARALGVEVGMDLEELRRLLADRCRGLERYAVDHDGLKAFLLRIGEPHGDTETWFRRLLLFLGRKPADKWSDGDRDAVELRLAEFARRVDDLVRLRLYCESTDRAGELSRALLVRTVRQGGEGHEGVVLLREQDEADLQGLLARLNEVLRAAAEPRLRRAAAALLAEQVFKEAEAAPRNRTVEEETHVDQPT